MIVPVVTTAALTPSWLREVSQDLDAELVGVVDIEAAVRRSGFDRTKAMREVMKRGGRAARVVLVQSLEALHRDAPLLGAVIDFTSFEDDERVPLALRAAAAARIELHVAGVVGGRRPPIEVVALRDRAMRARQTVDAIRRWLTGGASRD